MSEAGASHGAVVVTGGTGGIGSAICRLFAARGHTVAFTYRSRTEAANRLAGEIGATVFDSVALTDIDAVHGFLETVANNAGAIQTLVHAAGPLVPMAHLSRVDPKQYSTALRDEAVGFYTLAHSALGYLRSSRGSVVAVTTAATSRYPVRDGLSAGTKGSIDALIRAFAAEEGRFGVRFNAVGPGMLTDGMAARLIDSGQLDDEALAVTRRNIPLRRFGTAGDIAYAAYFLASAEAAFISGQKLNVDGGYST